MQLILMTVKGRNMKNSSISKYLIAIAVVSICALTTACGSESKKSGGGGGGGSMESGSGSGNNAGTRYCTSDELYYINDVYGDAQTFWRPTDLPETFQSCFFLEAKKRTYERLFSLRRSCLAFINNMPNIHSCEASRFGRAVDFLVADSKVDCRLLRSDYDDAYESRWRAKFRECGIMLND